MGSALLEAPSPLGLAGWVGSSGNKAAVGVMSRAQYENDSVIIQDALRWRADLAEYFHRLYVVAGHKGHPEAVKKRP
ncbi:MAG TPA: hypothetical protein PKD33_17850, partial [Rhodocyclaceae bacterium]|nr:hypothetical protein [Rhodocyclaceae bacterium]HNB47338.1 hypothetical protein [Burkholderiaceae bacterium]